MQKISESKVITKIIIDILRNKIDSYNKNIKEIIEDIDADDYQDEVMADSAKIEELKEVINQIQKIEMRLNATSN
jgi:mevalonate kinase